MSSEDLNSSYYSCTASISSSKPLPRFIHLFILILSQSFPELTNVALHSCCHLGCPGVYDLPALAFLVALMIVLSQDFAVFGSFEIGSYYVMQVELDFMSLLLQPFRAGSTGVCDCN